MKTDYTDLLRKQDNEKLIMQALAMLLATSEQSDNDYIKATVKELCMRTGDDYDDDED